MSMPPRKCGEHGRHTLCDSMSMKIPFRPISRVRDTLLAAGQEMSYAYEDLVFPNHSAYLLQMGEKGQDLFVHFNQECPDPSRPELLAALKTAGATQGLKVRFRGTFRMEESAEKELQIRFCNPA